MSDAMENTNLLDNTDDISFGTGAMRFADLTDHMDDADDSLESKHEEQKSEAAFFRKSAICVISYILIGMIFYCWICPLEGSPMVTDHNITVQANVTWIDSLYFTMVTLTTVGYGDFHPKDNDVASELFTCVFVLVGIIFVSIGLSFFVMQLLDKQERLIAGVLDNDEGITLPGTFGLSYRTWRVVISVSTCIFLMCLGMLVFSLAESSVPSHPKIIALG